MSEQLTRTNNVFFDPCGDRFGVCVQDAVLSNGRGQYSGKSLEDYRADYPLMMIVDIDQAIEWINDYYRSEPQEITKEEYWEMLEVLPPVGWKIYDTTESFKMSERLTGNITGVYCRIGSRYFVFNDFDSMPHDQIVEKVKASAAYKVKK